MTAINKIRDSVEMVIFCFMSAEFIPFKIR